jgi:hypothetical protein
MEMMIIAVVAVVAFAAVLIPLFRRGPRGVAPDEFEGDARPASPPRRELVREADPVHGEGVIPPMASGPVTPVDAAGSTDAEGIETAGAPVSQTGPASPAQDDGELELEIQRYRAALRAGTVCSKCGQANPAESAFCFDCGAALPRSEAQEFE